LRGRGYTVRINEVYKGVEIVKRQGRPAADRHSLQIEVDRALYMDQKTLEKTRGFGRLQADITLLMEALRGFTSACLEERACAAADD
jgi:N-formylglutamate deformylase